MPLVEEPSRGQGPLYFAELLNCSAFRQHAELVYDRARVAEQRESQHSEEEQVSSFILRPVPTPALLLSPPPHEPGPTNASRDSGSGSGPEA